MTASAQVFGTFSWQMQPYCNTVTLTLTAVAGQFALTGSDDLCGAVRKASAFGVAVFNPDGTVGFNFSIVATPGGRVGGVAASVSPATGQGSWTDDEGHAGTFAFFAGTPGLPLRPLAAPYFRTAGAAQQLIGLNVPIAVTSWTSAELDSAGGGVFDATVGTYTVPVAGIYALSVTLRLASASTTGQYCSLLFVNNVQKSQQCAELSLVANARPVTTSATLRLAAGDVVGVRALNATGAQGGVATGADNVFTVTRLQ